MYTWGTNYAPMYRRAFGWIASVVIPYVRPAWVRVCCRRAYVPKWNSAVVFRVPRYHAVTALTTDRPRYSVRGGLRGRRPSQPATARDMGTWRFVTRVLYQTGSAGTHHHGPALMGWVPATALR